MHTILIVEDDAPLGHFYSRILGFSGYETILATTCQEARHQLQQNSPDIILLDIILPDGNGLDLVDETAFDPTTAVVISSGDFKSAAQARGIQNYVNKPVSAEHLMRVMATITMP